MKKKKYDPTHYFYQELNLNCLMLKTNEYIFELLSLLIWITEVYIQGSMIKFFAFCKSHVSKNSNAFLFLSLLLYITMYLQILQFFYYIIVPYYNFVFENKWLIDWLIDWLVSCSYSDIAAQYFDICWKRFGDLIFIV